MRLSKWRTGKRGDFPGSPVASTGRVHRWGPGSIPGQGTKIPQARPKKTGNDIIKKTEMERGDKGA